MIELTDGQLRAVDMARQLVKNPGTDGVLVGPAGTGKTTVLKAILDEVGNGSVLLSPTGKAAARITELTGRGAGTIHRWLYKATDLGGTAVFELRPFNEINRPTNGLVVVDEASMVGRDVWADLRETCAALNCSILLVGDSFQLPPVQDKNEAAFSVLTPGAVGGYRVELTEILRQALDNPIIRITAAIREGDMMDAMMDLDVVTPEELDESLTRANMVICRSNKARHWLNSRCRVLRGYQGEPQVGEPLLILKNSYKLEVYNGEVHEFGGFHDNLGQQKVWDYETRANVAVAFQMTRLAGQNAILAPQVVAGTLDSLSPSQLEKGVSYYQKKGAGYYVHANYGYAMTAWKAQGSEADNVLVCLERGTDYVSEEGRRFLYTCLTRAKKSVAIAHIG